jgi:hypothetical protein
MERAGPPEKVTHWVQPATVMQGAAQAAAERRKREKSFTGY